MTLLEVDGACYMYWPSWRHCLRVRLRVVFSYRRRWRAHCCRSGPLIRQRRSPQSGSLRPNRQQALSQKQANSPCQNPKDDQEKVYNASEVHTARGPWAGRVRTVPPTWRVMVQACACLTRRTGKSGSRALLWKSVPVKHRKFSPSARVTEGQAVVGLNSSAPPRWRGWSYRGLKRP